MTTTGAKVFALMVLALLLSSSFLGAINGVQASMASMDGMVASNHCFMPGMTESLCQMNPLEHIAAWQGMFTAVQNSGVTAMFLLALLAFVFGAAISHVYRGVAPPLLFTRKLFSAYQRRSESITHVLQELFSSGILRSKAY